MKKLINAGCIAACLIFLCLYTRAQDKKDSLEVKKYQPFNANLQLRSLYIWRGFKVSNAPITNVDMYYISRDGSLQAGFWGGASFTGDYKEFDYYIKYTKGNFSAAIWDINNFSDYPNANIFDYKKGKTSHFVDVGVAYKIPMKLPLTVSWNTIILGRDTYTSMKGNLKSAYSHYVQLDQTVFERETYNVHAFVGGGFAFGTEKNFYGDRPNVVNAGITVNKDLVILNYHIPVSATAMLSPEHKYGALQLVANLF